MNTITNSYKCNCVMNLEPIDNKLEQLYSLMNVIQNTLEMPNGDIFNNDIAKLMEVGKDITTVCKHMHKKSK